jgi:hypothetical protein
MINKLATAIRSASIGWRNGLAALICALSLAQPLAWAQGDASQRIRDELVLVQQEQQAVFQQFQMVRELRSELLAPPPAQSPLSGYASGQGLPNYDDQVEEQRDRSQKVADYSQEMERLFARYQELDGRRKALVEELAKVGAR